MIATADIKAASVHAVLFPAPIPTASGTTANAKSKNKTPMYGATLKWSGNAIT